jgi:hypothetical protein
MIITFKLMPTNININIIAGQPPFNIYLCDSPTNCIYIDTITIFPYEFQIPVVIEGQNDYTLKVIDNNGCQSFKNLTL